MTNAAADFFDWAAAVRGRMLWVLHRAAPTTEQLRELYDAGAAAEDAADALAHAQD